MIHRKNTIDTIHVQCNIVLLWGYIHIYVISWYQLESQKLLSTAVKFHGPVDLYHFDNWHITAKLKTVYPTCTCTLYRHCVSRSYSGKG